MEERKRENDAGGKEMLLVRQREISEICGGGVSVISTTLPAILSYAGGNT